MVNAEKELQELMKQIDVMVATKKRDWEREREGLQSRLAVREKECLMQKSTLEQKHKEVIMISVYTFCLPYKALICWIYIRINDA